MAVAQESQEDAFDMISLRTHLPHKRKGLSMFFGGKSRSFTSIEEARSVTDLEKPEILPEAKRRKYIDRRDRIFSTAPCPCVGI